MGLYKMFSYNVEVQYKSCFLSKAMLFTIITTTLNLVLPFFIAYRSRGFWLRSHSFYEQPVVHFTYEYIFIAETDDPSKPLVCGEAKGLHGNTLRNEEHCVDFQVKELDYNGDGKNDKLEFRMYLNIPQDRTITSVMLILQLDFQLKSVCPMRMQSLAVMNKELVIPSSGLKFNSDLKFYQTSHLACKPNIIDNKYNISSFNYINNNYVDLIDTILESYYMRDVPVPIIIVSIDIKLPKVTSKDFSDIDGFLELEVLVTTHAKVMYSRVQNGHTGSMEIQSHIRVPEIEVIYVPSLMQELKWAWPQYLSLVFIFYWIFNRIKKFVFNHRLVMAWEIVPWKKQP